MNNAGRDLLVLLKQDFMNKQAVEREVESLNAILRKSESSYQFCKAHEFVDRNYITSKTSTILKAIRFVELKPFRFLINKN